MTDGPLAERLLREAVRLAGQCDAKLDAVATKHDLARAVRWFAAVQALTIVVAAVVVVLVIR